MVKKKASNLIGKGKPASKGTASGRAVFVYAENITDKGTQDNFKEGDILLAPMTDIEYLPIMRKAAAVLTSLGGRFCHAAVICNQLKTPCVVGIGSGIDLFRLHGKNITVNGTTGEILSVEE